MYRGSLTRNARIQLSHHAVRREKEKNCGKCHCDVTKILVCPLIELRRRRLIRSGRDAVTVYIIR